jgi:adenine-specific DNA-methyltransferase
LELTRHELKDAAEFLSDYSFKLRRNPFAGDYPLGLYELPRRSGEAHLYRLGHPLALALVKATRERELKPALIEFDLTNHAGIISILEAYKGQTGTLSAAVLTVNVLEQSEEYVLLAGITQDGKPLGNEAIKRLFTLDGTVVHESPAAINTGVSTILDKNEREVIAGVSQRNIDYVENEAEKLDGWAEDLKLGLEREIKDIDKQIKETRLLSVATVTLDEKVKRQREIKSLESTRNTKRKSLFDAQDDIDRRRDALIESIEAKLKIGYSKCYLRSSGD